MLLVLTVTKHSVQHFSLRFDFDDGNNQDSPEFDSPCCPVLTPSSNCEKSGSNSIQSAFILDGPYLVLFTSQNVTFVILDTANGVYNQYCITLNSAMPTPLWVTSADDVFTIVSLLGGLLVCYRVNFQNDRPQLCAIDSAVFIPQLYTEIIECVSVESTSNDHFEVLLATTHHQLLHLKDGKVVKCLSLRKSHVNKIIKCESANGSIFVGVLFEDGYVAVIDLDSFKVVEISMMAYNFFY
jgi:hypothetical protein